MKSTELYRNLREVLDPWCKDQGFKRMKSSPPAYTRAFDDLTLCLWFKVKSGGWDYTYGGEFTGALQLSDDPKPGIEWTEGNFWSNRLSFLFSPKERKTVQELHNKVVAKLQKPTKGHWLYDFGEDYLKLKFDPIKSPPKKEDFWFRYYDETDVILWAEFLTEVLPNVIKRYEKSVQNKRAK